MNKDIKAKWVAALRSGEYKQGTGVLQKEDGTFCCLGVLCDIYRKETGKGEWVDKHDQNQISKADGFIKVLHFLEFEESKNAFSPPHEVQVWAGIDPARPPNDPNADYHILAQMNDRGSTFAQIADFIDAKL